MAARLPRRYGAGVLRPGETTIACPARLTESARFMNDHPSEPRYLRTARDKQMYVLSLGSERLETGQLK